MLKAFNFKVKLGVRCMKFWLEDRWQILDQSQVLTAALRERNVHSLGFHKSETV